MQRFSKCRTHTRINEQESLPGRFTQHAGGDPQTHGSTLHHNLPNLCSIQQKNKGQDSDQDRGREGSSLTAQLACSPAGNTTSSPHGGGGWRSNGYRAVPHCPRLSWKMHILCTFRCFTAHKHRETNLNRIIGTRISTFGLESCFCTPGLIRGAFGQHVRRMSRQHRHSGTLFPCCQELKLDSAVPSFNNLL